MCVYAVCIWVFVGAETQVVGTGQFCDVDSLLSQSIGSGV